MTKLLSAIDKNKYPVISCKALNNRTKDNKKPDIIFKIDNYHYALDVIYSKDNNMVQAYNSK